MGHRKQPIVCHLCSTPVDNNLLLIILESYVQLLKLLLIICIFIIGLPGGSDSKHLPQCRRAMFHQKWRKWLHTQYSCLEHFMDREAWRLQFLGSQKRVGNNWATYTYLPPHYGSYQLWKNSFYMWAFLSFFCCD